MADEFAVFSGEGGKELSEALRKQLTGITLWHTYYDAWGKFHRARQNGDFPLARHMAYRLVDISCEAAEVDEIVFLQQLIERYSNVTHLREPGSGRLRALTFNSPLFLTTFERMIRIEWLASRMGLFDPYIRVGAMIGGYEGKIADTTVRVSVPGKGTYTPEVKAADLLGELKQLAGMKADL